ncbi:MAG: hypothetical protein JWM11_3786 [Planctomycetaceae bacterium]|nr:hypothetical protein [Planctomycetaceae bacterium]
MQRVWMIHIYSCCLVSLLTGCGSPSAVEKPASVAFKLPTDQFSEQELQKFLRLVSRLPDGKVPEFTPSTQPELDLNLPAKVLVSEFRTRFRFLCDPKRQGEVWSRNQELVKSARLEGWSTAQLAAFMRCLSCTVMKSKLSAKHDLAEIEARCRAEIVKLVAAIEQVDERPRSTMDEAFQKTRGQKVEHLGRMVALLEFTLQIKPVPKNNVTLVKQQESQIQGLLPKAALNDPYEAPFATTPATSDVGGGIVPAGYESR